MLTFKEHKNRVYSKEITMTDCEEYMLLNLDEVKIPELFLLLLDEHIGARPFIDSHDDVNLHGTFLRRFVIFITIVLIIFLKSISTFMACFGRFIEATLNLWSEYDSFCMLIVMKLRGLFSFILFNCLYMCFCVYI